MKKILKIYLVLCAVSFVFLLLWNIFILPRKLSVELEKRSLFYAHLIKDVNSDGISDINDIYSVGFPNAINVQPEVSGNKITVFFRSVISDFMGPGQSSISGPYFDAEYKKGVLHVSNQFINECIKGLMIADHFNECRYIVSIEDVVDVYSDDKAHYYYESGNSSNLLMVRKAIVKVYDVSSGNCVASNTFVGRQKILRSEIRIKTISTPEPNNINEFLTGIIGQ